METRLKDPEHRKEIEESATRQENRLLRIEELEEANRFLIQKVRAQEKELAYLKSWPSPAEVEKVLASRLSRRTSP